MSEEKQIHISFCPFGLYAFALPENEVAGQIEFPNDAKKAVEIMDSCGGKDLSKTELQLLKELSKNPQYKDRKIFFETKKEKYMHLFPNKCGEYLRNSRMSSMSRKNMQFIVELSVEMCEKKAKEKNKEIDLVIIMSSAITDIEKAMNSLFLHAKDMIELNCPYLKYEHSLDSEEKYIRYINKNTGEILADIKDKSTVKCIENYIKEITELQKQKENLKKQIEHMLKKETPTLCNLIGADLCAKYLQHTGGLRRLAFFPSSTIQVLGAEKALFRHLKTGALSPKYGILYMSSYVMSAKAKNKGKIARLLAIKISLAAKMDLNKNKGWIERIKKDFEKGIEKI